MKKMLSLIMALAMLMGLFVFAEDNGDAVIKGLPATEIGYDVYKPENMSFVGNIVISTNTAINFTGSGFVDSIGQDRFIKINVSATDKGSKSVKIKFAAEDDKSISITNQRNRYRETTVFESQGLNTWIYKEIVFNLEKGDNTIEISTDSNKVYIDYVAVSQQLKVDKEPGFSMITPDKMTFVKTSYNYTSDNVTIGADRNLDFEYYAAEEGKRRIRINFATDIQGQFIINNLNNSLTASLPGEPHISWVNYFTGEAEISMLKGINTIKLQYTGLGVDVKYIAISKDIEREIGYTIYQPEDMELTGTSVIRRDNALLYSGNGFVDCVNVQNNIKIKFNNESKGTKKIKIRYNAEENGVFSINDNLINYNSAKTDGDWSYVEAEMPVISGANVITISANKDVLVDYVAIGEKTDISTVIVELLKGSTVGEAKALVDANYSALGIDFKTDKYFVKINETTFYETLLKTDFETMEDLKNQIYKAIAIVSLKTLDDVELLEAVSVFTDIKKIYKLLDLKYKDYGFTSLNSEDLRVAQAEMKNSLSVTEEDLNTDILKATVKAMLNTVKESDKATYISILLKNDDALGISNTYGAWVSNGKKQRAAQLYLLDKTFTTWEQFLNHLDAAIIAGEAVVEKVGTPNVPSDRPGKTGGKTFTEVPFNPAVTEDVSKKTPRFIDVDSNHWAYTAIEAMAEKKVLLGYVDGSFKPNSKVTREEFIKILLSGLNMEVGKYEAPFADVKESDWYYSYVTTAYKLNIIKGLTEKGFGIGGYITRQDMAVMIERALKVKNITLPQSDKEKYADIEQIDSYALTPILLMQRAGLLNGMSQNMFMPKDNVTRAMAAQSIWNVGEIIK